MIIKDIFRKNLRYIKFIVSICLVLLAFRYLDFYLIQSAILKLNAREFLFSASIILLMFILMFFRWLLIFGNISKPRVFYVFAVFFKSLFINFFTPANIGGDVFRLMTLSSSSVSKSQVMKALLTERFFGFFGFIIIFAISYLIVFGDLREHNFFTTEFIFACGLLFLLFVFLCFGKKLLFFIKSFVNFKLLLLLSNVFDFFLDFALPKRATGIMILTFTSTVMWFFSINIVAKSIGLHLSLFEVALVATTVEIIRFIPLTVQGLGLREGLFAILLGGLGYSYELSYTLGILSYAMLSVCILLCGPIAYLVGLLDVR